MPADYAENLRQDRPLALLQPLVGAPDYPAHAHLLRTALEGFGHRVSFDAVRGDLAWLAEQGLVLVTGGEIPVATLTVRGEDVARGRSQVPGVARKLPGDFLER